MSGVRASRTRAAAGRQRAAAGGAAVLLLAALASFAQVRTAPPAAAATTPTTATAGWTHACLIRSGKAYCWGDNTYGELGNNSTVGSTVPVPVYTGGALSGVTLSQITAGNGFTCALSSAGAVYCWGANNYGELGINSGQAVSAVPVAVSTAGVLSGVTVTQVSAGEYHACAMGGGAAYCWGWNAWGQLGNGTTTNSTAPVAVSISGVLSGLTLTQVSAGGLHTCALAGGKVYCWGGNPHGELGNGNTTNSSVPVAVSTSGVLFGLTLTGITAGYEHTCALSLTGAEYCWGSDAHGELGNGSGTDSSVPVAVSTSGALSGITLSQITAGNLTSCALSTTGAAYCWGRGTSGELGNNGSSTLNTPQAVYTSGVLSGKTLTQVSTGQQFTCALDSSGGSYCWGTDANGRLGNPATSLNSSVPEAITSNSSVTIAAGQNHGCAISPGGAAYCWGDDTYGELGNGTTTATPQTSPVAVSTSGVLSGVTLTQISVGTNDTCALSNSGVAYCWGQDQYGQLGNNTTSATQSTPVAVYTAGVLSGVKLIQISAGNQHTCALSTAGAVYCWGYNTDGELGNSSNANSSAPVAVTTSGVLSGVAIAQVSVEHLATCAVGANGAAYCWGYNTDGELGNNSTSASNVPVAVYTGGNLSGKFLTQVSGSALSACAIDSTGKAYCWGSNVTYGQLGNGSFTNSSVAVAVSTSGVLSGVSLALITTGAFNGCAVSTAGADYCWGNNADGEFGSNNFTSPSNVPVATYTGGVLSGQVLSQVTGGYYSTCAAGGPAALPYCWGQDTAGQLDNGGTTNSSAAVITHNLDPGPPTGVVAVPAATSMTVYFTAPSDDGFGTVSSYTVTATPGAGSYPGGGAPVSGTCTTSGTSCTVTGLTNGAVYLVTVVTNTSAGASVASAPASATPWPPDNAIAAGFRHGCAISGGNAYCWGDNTYGELGNNSTTGSTVPVAVYAGGVLSGVTLTQIVAGDYFTCALSSAGAVYCWGDGAFGELGNNSTTNSAVPVAVYTGGALSGVTITQIATSGYTDSTCALSSTGAVYCWGYNNDGQLGNNSTTTSSVPVAVTTSGVLSGVTLDQVAVGYYSACALSTAGAAYCWGYNAFGQLGNNSTSNSSVPVAVTTSGVLSGVTLTQVSEGATHTCVLSSTDVAYCWGYNNDGQLGNNSTSNSSVPVAVTTSGALYGVTLTDIAGGEYFTCGLASTGAAYCWGYDTYGQLGNNSTSNSSVPVAVTTSGVLSGVILTQVSTGTLAACVLSSTGTAYCWGYDTDGELGNNSTAQSNVAAYVAPQAPTGLSGITTATTVAVSWTAPAYTNNGTITGYTATASPGNATCTTTGATSCTITGLTAGTTYTITVTVTASPTGSATSASISETTSALQLTSPSSLTWSVTFNGLNQAVADQVSGDQQLTVLDSTGTGAGWHITVSATTLSSGIHTLPNAGTIVFTGSTSSSASTSAPTATCVSSCTLPTDTSTYPVSITTAASSPTAYTVYDTQASTGEGPVTIGGSSAANPVGWWVKVPAASYTGPYTTTVTVQLISGP